MFDVLSKGFKSARLKMSGRAEITEDSLGPALREVRTSLIQADVEISVVREFIAQVKTRSLGRIVPVKGPGGQKVKLTPQDWFIKACYDQLVELMGPEANGLDLEGSPAVVMLVGLQGSGKTTTAGKLAKLLVSEGRRPLLVAADIYRPAAVEQLLVIGRKLAVPVFSIKGMKPVQLAKLAVAQAKNTNRDVVIIDTAGRLAVDDTLMVELEQIKSEVGPSDLLFVCDAMMGQDAVRTAAEFDRRLDFSGFILTKLDGDARGGAALSIKAVTGKPVKFLGQGEELDRLEAFRPEGLAQRILGMGDIVGLVQDFEKHVDPATAMSDAEKMLQGTFSYDDFVRQLSMIRKMGPLKDIMSKIPMLSGMMDQIPEEAFDDGEMDRTLAIIQSMTHQERRRPFVLDEEETRFDRIARGSGRSLDDVKALHERFLMARDMMKNLGGMMGNPAQMAGMQQQMAGMGGGGFAGMPGFGGAGQGPAAAPKKQLSGEDRAAKRKKQKASRKARKRNRK